MDPRTSLATIPEPLAFLHTEIGASCCWFCV